MLIKPNLEANYIYVKYNLHLNHAQFYNRHEMQQFNGHCVF